MRYCWSMVLADFVFLVSFMVGLGAVGEPKPLFFYRLSKIWNRAPPRSYLLKLFPPRLQVRIV